MYDILQLHFSFISHLSNPNNKSGKHPKAKGDSLFIWPPQVTRRNQRGPRSVGRRGAFLKLASVLFLNITGSQTLNNSWLIWLPWDKLFLLRLCYTRNRALRGEIPLQSQSEITLCVVFRLFSFGRRKKEEANF